MSSSSEPDSTIVPLETRLVVTARSRDRARLDELAIEPPPADPSPTSLLSLAAQCSHGSVLWLVGGEPTLRADLPALIAALGTASERPLGLCSDGLAFSDRAALQPLLGQGSRARAGLQRVRISLHCGRTDAHDWLVGQTGAARRAIQALRLCSSAGLAVEVCAVVTRPTLPYLSELVKLCAHLGVEVVHLRQLPPYGRAADELHMLAPRLGMLQRPLCEASVAAARSDCRLVLHGFPACAIDPVLHHQLPDAKLGWLVPANEDWQALRARLRPHHRALQRRQQCPSCPGTPGCSGVPAELIEPFSSQELSTLGKGDSNEAAQTVQVEFGAPSPVSCEACDDGTGTAPVESTRALRLRLVRAARAGAKRLRIASAASLWHPAAPTLIREACLLFEQVQVAGEASVLDRLSDADLFDMSALSRIDVALYGPDAARHDAHVGRPGAFEAMQRGLARLEEVAGTFAKTTPLQIGAYAVSHDAAWDEDFARAWRAGHLPARVSDEAVGD